jgi:hypothetical protein
MPFEQEPRLVLRPILVVDAAPDDACELCQVRVLVLGYRKNDVRPGSRLRAVARLQIQRVELVAERLALEIADALMIPTLMDSRSAASDTRSWT